MPLNEGKVTQYARQLGRAYGQPSPAPLGRGYYVEPTNVFTDLSNKLYASKPADYQKMSLLYDVLAPVAGGVLGLVGQAGDALAKELAVAEAQVADMKLEVAHWESFHETK